MKRILLLTAACVILTASLRAEEQKKQDSMQCCCMKAKHADTAKIDEAAKDRDAELNKLIDEFKEAPQDRKLDILAALLSKMVEQRKLAEDKEHDHSAH